MQIWILQDFSLCFVNTFTEPKETSVLWRLLQKYQTLENSRLSFLHNMFFGGHEAQHYQAKPCGVYILPFLICSTTNVSGWDAKKESLFSDKF